MFPIKMNANQSSEGSESEPDMGKIGKLIDSAISQLGQIKGMLSGGKQDEENFSESMAQNEEKE